MDIKYFLSTPRIIIVFASLVAFSSTFHAQNNLIIFGGLNKTFLGGNTKSVIVSTTGNYGFTGGAAVERMFKKHSITLEANISYQGYEMLIGPLFFPDDLPTSSGSFYNISYSLKNINILPIFNYCLIDKWLYIPFGVGIQKTFSSFESELVRPSGSYPSETEFYKTPNINASVNTGLNFALHKGNAPSLFLALRYSLSLLPIRPLFSDYKKMKISSISLLAGIKI